MDIPNKKCSKCGKIFPWTNEYFNYRNKNDGKLRGPCKECTRESGREYSRKNYKENPEKARESSREWSKENPEKERERWRKYREENPEKVRESLRKYREENPEKVKESMRESNRKQYEKKKDNPEYILNKRISGGMGYSLKGNKNGHHWESMVNYDLKELKEWLEERFEKGMSWDNFGEWHIDHTTPISWFIFQTHNETGAHYCWSLYNLQPMWANENISKNNYKTNDNGLIRYLLCSIKDPKSTIDN